MSDPRDTFIQQVSRGLTFAEVGGLWGLVNEKVSVAALSGASELTQIDCYDKDDPAWEAFHSRVKDLGIQQPVESISCDFQTYDGKEFDVIHSGGVFYHLPSPFLYLTKLREKARKHVILTSLITPGEIENEYGKYQIPPSGAIFVPGLSEEERKILNEFWKIPGLLGIGSETQFQLNDFAPVWWLTTDRVLRKMCEIAGFSIQDDAYLWPEKCLTLLLR